MGGANRAGQVERSTEIALKQKDRDQALRERLAEQTRRHQERVAAATEADAVARRITDPYTKAADQLGSDKAPVCLARLHALERPDADPTSLLTTFWAGIDLGLTIG